MRESTKRPSIALLLRPHFDAGDYYHFLSVITAAQAFFLPGLAARKQGRDQ
jgi:hypothetical protein